MARSGLNAEEVLRMLIGPSRCQTAAPRSCRHRCSGAMHEKLIGQRGGRRKLPVTQPAEAEVGDHEPKAVALTAGTLSMPVLRDRRAFRAGERPLGTDSLDGAKPSDFDACTTLARRGRHPLSRERSILGSGELEVIGKLRITFARRKGQSPNYQVQRPHADLSARGRAAPSRARGSAARGRAIYVSAVRCNAELCA